MLNYICNNEYKGRSTKGYPAIWFLLGITIKHENELSLTKRNAAYQNLKHSVKKIIWIRALSITIDINQKH